MAECHNSTEDEKSKAIICSLSKLSLVNLVICILIQDNKLKQGIVLVQ